MNIKHAHFIFRKFADIANTVQEQFRGGVYKISQWADLVTAHPLPGPDMISHMFGDSSTEERRTCGSVLILEMSTKNALTTPSYAKGLLSLCLFFSYQENIPLIMFIFFTTEAAAWGLAASEVVVGFVGQSPPEADCPSWIQFTPGVSSSSSGDSKGQQYCSPTEAVLERGADIIIVGRGLTKSADLVSAAENYRSEGWAALTQRVLNH